MQVTTRGQRQQGAALTMYTYMNIYIFSLYIHIYKYLYIHIYIYVSFSFALKLDKIGPQSAQKIYQKYIQDISKMCKINTKMPSGRRPGPGRAGPSAAWYFVFILDILDMSLIYLDIFMVYFLRGLGSNFDEATNEKLPYVCVQDLSMYIMFSLHMYLLLCVHLTPIL